MEKKTKNKKQDNDQSELKKIRETGVKRGKTHARKPRLN